MSVRRTACLRAGPPVESAWRCTFIDRWPFWRVQAANKTRTQTAERQGSWLEEAASAGPDARSQLGGVPQYRTKVLMFGFCSTGGRRRRS